jgi:4-hydroxy-3-polyprenylbenzoate decarboxylase
LHNALPGKVLNAYCPPSGGGKFDAILQFQKTAKSDEGRQGQAALCVLAVLPEVKNVFIVGEDVDIFDPYDVQWALTTRFRPDLDLTLIPGIRCHPGDPTQKQFYDPQLRDNGIAYKAIYDATVPFEHKEKFYRPEFLAVGTEGFL